MERAIERNSFERVVNSYAISFIDLVNEYPYNIF